MLTRRNLLPLAGAALLTLIPLTASAATDMGVTRRVSVANNTNNGDANGESSRALVSGNGRYVVYHSEANNLVANDTHLAKTDVFRTDMGVSPPRTAMVSVDYLGRSPNDDSSFPAVSNDGRYVAFMSDASDIVRDDAGDTQGDVFRRDMVTGVTERVSITASGHDPGGLSTRPSISDDGRWVAFNSTAPLVPNDPGGMDVYLRDMSKAPGTTGWMTRVTAGASGAADDDSLRAILSGDGNFITFVSDDSRLVPNDTNGARDVYRWERSTGKIVRASVTSSGGNINRGGTRPWINGDGRYVTFQSSGPATPGDNNGVDDVFRADFGSTLHANPPKIERVSVTPSGGDAAGASTRIQINYDGRYVVFASNSHQLTSGDQNQARDVFRRDMVLGQTVRVSVSPSGGDSMCGSAAPAGTLSPLARAGAANLSTRPDISNDGMHVIFVSGSCNLTPSDDNGLDDIFIRDYA